MLYVVSFLGQFIGWLLAWRTEEELKQGRKYFLVLSNLMLVLLIAISVYYSFDIYLLVLGLVSGFFINKEYLFFGILAFRNDFLLNSFIFIYGLPYGSLNYKNFNMLIINVFLFFIPFLLLFFDMSFYSLGAGGLAGVLIKRIYLNKFRRI